MATAADYRTQPRVSAKRRREMLAGMQVMRGVGWEEGGRHVPLERNGNDVVMRVRLIDVDATGWVALNKAFESGAQPWVIVDKSGMAVELREAVMKSGKAGRLGNGANKLRILDALPKGVDLPGDIKWTDFTERQLRALLMMSDVTTDRTRTQIAAVCGVEDKTLDQWEGNEKFLRIKRWMLERSRHRMREQLFKNIGVGMENADTSQRLAWSKMAAELLGYAGRGKGGIEKPKDAGVEADVRDELAGMSDEERSALGKEFKLMAKLLADSGTVIADESGRLAVVKPKGDSE